MGKISKHEEYLVLISKINGWFKGPVMITGADLPYVHFSRMRFIEKTDCKLSVSKWQCQWLQHLQNKKHIFLLLLDFSADSSLCS